MLTIVPAVLYPSITAVHSYDSRPLSKKSVIKNRWVWNVSYRLVCSFIYLRKLERRRVKFREYGQRILTGSLLFYCKTLFSHWSWAVTQAQVAINRVGSDIFTSVFSRLLLNVLLVGNFWLSLCWSVEQLSCWNGLKWIHVLALPLILFKFFFLHIKRLYIRRAS